MPVVVRASIDGLVIQLNQEITSELDKCQRELAGVKTAAQMKKRAALSGHSTALQKYKPARNQWG